MMKKFACILLALVMVLSLAACGNTTTNDNTPADGEEFDPSAITLTWCSPIINHPVLRCCELGFIDACKELGYKYQIVGSENVDYNEANAAAEAAAAAGSPAMLLWVGDEVAVNGCSTLYNDYGTIVGGPHIYWEEGSVPSVWKARPAPSPSPRPPLPPTRMPPLPLSRLRSKLCRQRASWLA